MSLWPRYPEQEEENKKPEIVAECWTCAQDGCQPSCAPYGLELNQAGAKEHRAAGHDVRPVEPQKASA